MGNSERRASRSSCGAMAFLSVLLSLAPGPLRLPLFEERLDALLLVGGGEAEAEEVSLVGDALLDVHLLAGAHRFLGDLQREWAHAGDPAGELQGLGAQLLGGHHDLDETDASGFRRVDHVAGEDEAHGLADADEAGEALRAAAARDEAELDLRLAEARLFRGDPDVARQRELASAAQAEAVDHGDDRLGKARHDVEDPRAAHGVPLVERRTAGELADV